MKNNSRAIRTSKSITNAFISLLKEKSFEKITIQDILEKTPVTRGTFYSYFHDKYEIVEKMHEQFFELREEIRKEIEGCSPEQAKDIIRKSTNDNKDLLQALIKIRTPQLDVKEIICSELENYYLEKSESPSKDIEAKIYAQARTEIYLNFLCDPNKETSLEHISRIYLSVALNLLRLNDDQETVDFLKQKLNL